LLASAGDYVFGEWVIPRSSSLPSVVDSSVFERIERSVVVESATSLARAELDTRLPKDPI
jgi:hypothetical protein